jgi:hypothetical protein
VRERSVWAVAIVTAGGLASWCGGPAVRAAPPSLTCVDGWTSPDPGSALYEEGLGILSGYFGLSGPIEVAEIRYFIGPEVPWILDPSSDVEYDFVTGEGDGGNRGLPAEVEGCLAAGLPTTG